MDASFTYICALMRAFLAICLLDARKKWTYSIEATGWCIANHRHYNYCRFKTGCSCKRPTTSIELTFKTMSSFKIKGWPFKRWEMSIQSFERGKECRVSQKLHSLKNAPKLCLDMVQPLKTRPSLPTNPLLLFFKVRQPQRKKKYWDLNATWFSEIFWKSFKIFAILALHSS